MRGKLRNSCHKCHHATEIHNDNDNNNNNNNYNNNNNNNNNKK